MAGAESHVRMSPDSTGKKMRTVKEVIGADDVHNEGVVVVDPTDTTKVLGVFEEDTAHSTGDNGIVAMVVRKDTPISLAGVDGDYTIPICDESGRTYVRPEATFVVDHLDDHTAWAALGNDTLNLATNTQYHIDSTASVEFDKVDGAANTVFGVIDQTIASLNISAFHIYETLNFATSVSSTAAIDYLLLRLGTDNANYNEWRLDGAEITAGEWNIIKVALGSASIAGALGTGMNPAAVTYVAIGYAFNNQNDTLADIRFNHLAIHTSQHTNADISAEVSSEVSSPNVNVKKWGTANVTTDQGVSDTGTLRVAVADDDTNLAAITTAVQILDNSIAGAETQVDIVSPGTAAGSLGKAEDAAHTTGDVGVAVLAVRADSPTSRTNVDGDYINTICDEYGRPKILTLHEQTVYEHAFFNAAADGNLVALVGGKCIKVHSITIQAAGTVTVNIRTDDAVGTILASWTLQAREGVVYPFVPYPAHHFQSAAGENLYVDVTAAVNVTINCIYTDDDAA